MEGIAGIVLALALSQQPADTVAITVTPDSTVEVIARVDAEAQFTKLCKDGTNDRRLRALAAALNPMPNWPQYVMNGDASVCNRNPAPLVPIPIEKQSGSVFVKKGQSN